MKAQSLQLGTYQIQNAYIEMHNGKAVPMATAIFIGINWFKFDYNPRKIRLQGLFNPSSVGPKEEFSRANIQSLDLYMVQIINLIERPHPLDQTKTQYIVEWDAYKPSNYDELIQQEMEILEDILQGTSIEAENQEELQAIEMDFLLIDEYEAEELADPNNDEELPEDEDDFEAA